VDRTRHRSIGWSTFVVVALTAAVVAPVTAWAQHRFADVPPHHTFAADISWLATTGVTEGCNRDGSLFCPEDRVTRGQMAAFLHRLAIGTVIDAATLEGRGAREFLAADGVAVDSRRLGGRTASSYLGVAETAADSDRLGGKAASSYIAVGDTATDSARLGGRPASAYLGSGDTATNSARLGGRLPEDFLAADGTAADSALVDGLDASAISRITGASASGPPVVATVNAPVDGIVAVTAVVGYQIPSGTGGWTCSLTAGPTGRRELVPGTVQQGSARGSSAGSCVVTGVVELEAGSNQVAIEATASGSTVLVAGSLSAVFSPFDAANP
jgi:S-layer homology domain